MKQYIAQVKDADYSFDINAEDHADAHATAVEHLQIIGMEEWIDSLLINLKE